MSPRCEERGFPLTFGDRHIPSRNTKNPDDEQYRESKAVTRFGCEAGLGFGWPQGLLSWARGAFIGCVRLASRSIVIGWPGWRIPARVLAVP